MTRRVNSGRPDSHRGDRVRNAATQLAWLVDVDFTPHVHLPPIVDNRRHGDDDDDLHGSAQGQIVHRSADDDAGTDDVGRPEEPRRHHKRGRKKCRRHRHQEQPQQQQPEVPDNSASFAGVGHIDT